VRVEKKLSERGIEVLGNRKAKAILGDKEVKYVELEDGQKIRADVVILGIGVIPNIRLALNSGLEAGRFSMPCRKKHQKSKVLA